MKRARRDEAPELKTDDCLDRAIAAVIANTRRVRRRHSISEIADWIKVVRKGTGSLRMAAETLGLSEQMLREFLAERKLAAPVRRLVREREIDSVDIVRRLGVLHGPDQIAVASGVASGELDSADVRSIIGLRKMLRDAPISDLIERACQSRVQKEYVAHFHIPAGRSLRALKRSITSAVGEGNVVSLDVKGDVGTLVLTAEGMRLFQATARPHGMTKRGLINAIARGDVQDGRR